MTKTIARFEAVPGAALCSGQPDACNGLQGIQVIDLIHFISVGLPCVPDATAGEAIKTNVKLTLPKDFC